MPGTEKHRQHGTAVKDRDQTRTPRLFRVMLLNDDYTTMEFVVDILTEVFKKTEDEAVEIMLRVHQDGKGLAGVYPRQIAETKIAAVHGRARRSGYPLRCALEPES